MGVVTYQSDNNRSRIENNGQVLRSYKCKVLASWGTAQCESHIPASWQALTKMGKRRGDSSQHYPPLRTCKVRARRQGEVKLTFLKTENIALQPATPRKYYEASRVNRVVFRDVGKPNWTALLHPPEVTWAAWWGWQEQILMRSAPRSATWSARESDWHSPVGCSTEIHAPRGKCCRHNESYSRF